MPADAVKKLFLPVLLALCTDPVPNIRMNVAKTIGVILPHVKGTPDLEVSESMCKVFIGKTEANSEGTGQGSGPGCQVLLS
jgi:hypothetical protein